MSHSRLQVMGSSHPGDSELFSWPSANLFLDEGTNHCSLLESGPFSLFLTAHSRCRLLTFVEAAVSALRWPVGKDSLVTILHSPCPPSASFLFAFPANEEREKLVYKLHLLPRLPPLSHDGSDILKFHALLQLYASAQVEPEDSGPPLSTMTCLERDAQEYWSKIGANGRPNQNSEKRDHGKYSSRAECEDTMQTRNMAAARVGDSRCGKRMMKKIQKARRVSAVSKLLSKAIASGIISGNAHVQVQEAASYPVSSACLLPPPILAAKDEAEKPVRQAVAKVEAVTKIVDAVDKRRTTGSHGDGKNDEQWKNCSDHQKAAINKENQAKAIATLADWTLNEAGLQLLLNLVIAASCCKREAPSMQTPSNLSTITSLHTCSAVSYPLSCATASTSTALRRHRPPLPRTPSNRSQLSSQASSSTHVVTSST